MKEAQVTFCALSLLAPVGVARMRPSEKAALWSLYEMTGGESWTHNTHWDLAKEPCQKLLAPVPHRFSDPRAIAFEPGAHFDATPWHGVGCVDPCDDYLDGPKCTAGRVSSLKLRANGLSGEVSGWTSVGQLANLSYLDLSDNSLSGALPSELGSVKNLVSATLSRNSLSGTLPGELGAINSPGAHRLEELVLAHNSISGSLPTQLGLHLRLVSLDASYNALSGSVPSQIGALTALQVLYLQSNAVSGTLPPVLGRATALRYLRLEVNSLSGQLPLSLGRADSMLTMHVHANRLHGTLPTQFGGLQSLRALTLNTNSISGAVPSQLGLLRELETLDLYSNALTGDAPATLAELANLRLLYLQNEQLRPLRQFHCQQRMPNVGKYSYRIVREEYHRMMTSICPEPYDTATAFLTLQELDNDDL